MSAPTRPPRREAGFTLVELLVVITILGVISFALTESLILGLKTTDGTIGDVSRAAGIQILEPYFSADVQSAELVSTTDSDCATEPVFLHLMWTEIEPVTARDVSYSLDPLPGGEHDLIRWSCAGGGDPDRKVLGHFSHDPAGPPPVSATCDSAPCPVAPPGAPATVTLVINTDRTASPAATKLTVRRRTA